MTAPGHGICRTCNDEVGLLSDGTCELHYKSSRFNHCGGSFHAPVPTPCVEHVCGRCDTKWEAS